MHHIESNKWYCCCTVATGKCHFGKTDNSVHIYHSQHEMHIFDTEQELETSVDAHFGNGYYQNHKIPETTGNIPSSEIFF